MGVSVRDGVVTLTGLVDSYYKKVQAEMTAKKIAGVRAVAEDIQVGYSPEGRKTDTEIAMAVAGTLTHNSALEGLHIDIRVEHGDITLQGNVEWYYQRKAAADAIAGLTGIHRIYNFITVTPKTWPTDLRQDIISALQRNSRLDPANIFVAAHKGKVTLWGMVRSVAERDEAEDVCWQHNGVTEVQNELTVKSVEFAD
ncbi:BON domain-containing protein [Puia sp. P3]|uniref:BON domain-containing protein n=1 Tax=Puia sp. P3 TaxID=3423952 RepID=UPI003D67B793